MSSKGGFEMLFNRRPFFGMEQAGPMMGPDMFDNCGCKMEPIIEQPIERCVRRDFCHEIQHVCPIHTRIINNHIFRHTYVPHYTCSEENICSNIDQGSCCQFR